MEKNLNISWWRSAIKEANDLAPEYKKCRKTMMKCYRQILYSRPRQCQLPCTHESYKGKTRKMGKSFENKKVNPNEMYIRLTYTTTDTEIHDEVLIQDLSTFIGTVGGSLGLFIGFSYTGLIGKLLNYFLPDNN